MKEFFIPGSVPSSKNSKQVTFRNGKPLVLWSKAAQEYKKKSKPFWVKYCNEFRFAASGSMDREPIYPIKVSFKFIRGSKHKFDYINPLQTICDLMVEFGWIPDDNADIILPIFEEYSYSKENPGVIIKIIN